LKKREKKGVSKKKPEECIEVANMLRGRVDALLMHESPKLPPPEYSFMTEDGGFGCRCSYP